MSDKVIISRDNGKEEALKIPEFGKMIFTIQNGKVYKVEKTESILMNK